MCVCVCVWGGGAVSVWRSESKQLEKMRGANVAAAGGRVWRGEEMKIVRRVKSNRKSDREKLEGNTCEFGAVIESNKSALLKSQGGSSYSH